MRFAQSAPPPLEALETPYSLRRHRVGDERGWLTLLNGGGELGHWTLERLGAECSSFLVANTQYFVLCDGEIVSGAGVYERSSACWEIGWVATSPDHRGRNLARHVCVAAVGAALELPPRPIWLVTDDFRSHAIKLYLRLGFRPDCHHHSHPNRWRIRIEQFGPEYAEYLDADV
jgi:GNAT superfamily N-acetyltransferase